MTTLQCQTADCGRPAEWIIRNYLTKGGSGAIKFGTRDLLRCEDHSKDARNANPFTGWEKLR